MLIDLTEKLLLCACAVEASLRAHIEQHSRHQFRYVMVRCVTFFCTERQQNVLTRIRALCYSEKKGTRPDKISAFLDVSRKERSSLIGEGRRRAWRQGH